VHVVADRLGLALKSPPTTHGMADISATSKRRQRAPHGSLGRRQ
jgi:hypothetical protein